MHLCLWCPRSSEESAKAKTRKELIKTLKDLKRHFPSEKRKKSNTLSTLKYALRCVKQVEGKEPLRRGRTGRSHVRAALTHDSGHPQRWVGVWP